MRNEKVFLQGLNYRVNDREAVPGTCRELRDLYPSGDTQAPVWKPAAGPDLYFNSNLGRVKSAYAWHRTNTPSCMIVLMIDGIGGGALYTNLLNDDGSINANVSPVEVYRLHHATEETEAWFAQLGDTLVACITEAGRSADLVVLADIKGELVSTPYNIPDLPNVSMPASFNRPMTDTPDSANVKKAYTGYYFGFRFAWILQDGTIARLSNVNVRKYAIQTLEEEMPSGRVRRSGTSREFTTAQTFEIPDNLVYFGGNGVECSVVGPVNLDSKFKGIVKSIAVFISEPQKTIEGVLHDSIYFKYGEITDIFESGKKSLPVEFKLDELLALPILEEDDLSSHDVHCSNVFSYNKSLLMSNVTYTYRLPYNANGTVSTEADTVDTTLNVTEVQYTSGHILRWTTATAPIEVTVELYRVLHGDVGTWTMEYSGTAKEYQVSHTGPILARVRAKFAAGVFSSYVELQLAAIPQYPNPFN